MQWEEEFPLPYRHFSSARPCSLAGSPRSVEHELPHRFCPEHQRAPVPRHLQAQLDRRASTGQEVRT
jgi:hypothetical protein